MSLPLPTDNPFLSKNYIVYETNGIWTGCNTSTMPSKIRRVIDPKLTDQSYTEIGPMSYKEVEEYIATQLMDLYAKVKLAKQCDDYGLAMNTNTSIVFPTECNATFTNFSNSIIEETRRNILTNPVNGSKYTTQFISDQGFSRFFYTSDYLSANQNNKNAQKPICQRMSDLVQMLTDIDTILKNMNTADVKQKYPDQYSSIVQKVNANKQIRTVLEERLREIYASNGSRFENSKLYLDSTVYTTVLWTILATTLLYYCFRKL